MTGADVRTCVVKRSMDGRDLLQGLDVIRSVMVDAYLLQNETRVAVMLDEVGICGLKWISNDPCHRFIYMLRTTRQSPPSLSLLLTTAKVATRCQFERELESPMSYLFPDRTIDVSHRLPPGRTSIVC